MINFSNIVKSWVYQVGTYLNKLRLYVFSTVLQRIKLHISFSKNYAQAFEWKRRDKLAGAQHLL